MGDKVFAVSLEIRAAQPQLIYAECAGRWVGAYAVGKGVKENFLGVLGLGVDEEIVVTPFLHAG